MVWLAAVDMALRSEMKRVERNPVRWGPEYQCGGSLYMSSKALDHFPSTLKAMA
jgi:hypothetical protein